MASVEHKLQNEIRLALAPETTLFRANVGQAWTGSKCLPLANGDMIIYDARPFSTGLPPGFSDLFGLRPRLITQEDVGKVLGVFVAIEVKSPQACRETAKQSHFISFVSENGGLAGVARSVEAAQKIVTKGACTNE